MIYTMYDRAAVGVFSSHTDAEEAMRRLENAGISLQAISIIGRGTKAHEAVLGHYLPPEYVEQGLEHQSDREGIWLGGIFGLLIGFGTFFLPGIGLLVVLGPLAGLIGGMAVGAIGGEVTGQLAFTEVASDYRNWLVEGKFLVIVHCTSAEEPSVKQAMESMQSLKVTSHPMVLPTSL